MERALAKVNLRLKVVGRRSDGYHLLSMLNCSAELSDEVELRLTPSPDISLRVDPTGALLDAPESNLAVRAFRAFWRAFDFEEPPVGCSLRIKKLIPVGAGLGGGSSDAAAVLRVLTQHFKTFLQMELGLSDESFQHSLTEAALSCGADVPYALTGGLSWVTGVGEIVTPLQRLEPWPGELLIVAPLTPVPTKAFYERFRTAHPVVEHRNDADMETFARKPSVSSLTELIHNDFEAEVVAMVPEVAHLLHRLREAFPGRSGVTGSGSALFALVERSEAGRASDLAHQLQAEGVPTFRSRMAAPAVRAEG